MNSLEIILLASCALLKLTFIDALPVTNQQEDKPTLYEDEKAQRELDFLAQLRHQISEQEEPMLNKRAQTFVRFGKRAQTFVRFGKRAQTFVRFGRSNQEQM